MNSSLAWVLVQKVTGAKLQNITPTVYDLQHCADTIVCLHRYKEDLRWKTPGYNCLKEEVLYNEAQIACPKLEVTVK
jgi:hypothetical protein